MFPNSLMARLLKARYHPNSSFMDATSMPGMSFTWRSILSGREILARGIRYQVGDGSSISLWNGPWLPLPHNFGPYSSPMEGSETWVVGHIIDHEEKVWMPHMINELFTEAEAEIIMKIPLSHRGGEDRIVWHFDVKGIYNVKSGYSVARNFPASSLPTSSSGTSSGNYNALWNKIWRVRVPPKIRSFIWHLMRGILPTRVALNKKFPIHDTCCIFCNSCLETDLHIFGQCEALHWFWRYTSFGANPIFNSGISLQD